MRSSTAAAAPVAVQLSLPRSNWGVVMSLEEEGRGRREEGGGKREEGRGREEEGGGGRRREEEGFSGGRSLETKRAS